jgi:type VI secretion system protein ImpA
LGAAVAKDERLRALCQEAVAQTLALKSLLTEKLANDAPDLRPIIALVNGVLGVLPAELAESGDDVESAEGDEAQTTGGTQGSGKRGLSGGVNSREEAIRAIEMVCEYLERVEPANPAPLFLRRGSQLINQNFLQLMKLLAPDALAGVAGLVGIDPYSLDEPQE